MLEKLQEILESGDPDMPQVMSKFLDLFGGHDALARSLAVMMARQEGRYQGGKILSHKEAEGLGILTPVQKPEFYRQCLKMLFDALHDTDVFKRSGNPYEGVSIADMESQVAQMAWDRLDTDPKFLDLVFAKLENEVAFQNRLLPRIKGNELLMRRLGEVSAVIPAEAGRLTNGAV